MPVRPPSAVRVHADVWPTELSNVRRSALVQLVLSIDPAIPPRPRSSYTRGYERRDADRNRGYSRRACSR